MLSPRIFIAVFVLALFLSTPAFAQTNDNQNVLAQILDILKKIVELITKLLNVTITPIGAYGYVMIDPTGDGLYGPNNYLGDYAASSDIGGCGKYKTLDGMTVIIKKKDGSYCKEVPVNICRTVQGASHPFYTTGEKLPWSQYGLDYTISLNLPDGWTFALRKSEENLPPESPDTNSDDQNQASKFIEQAEDEGSLIKAQIIQPGDEDEPGKLRTSPAILSANTIVKSDVGDGIDGIVVSDITGYQDATKELPGTWFAFEIRNGRIGFINTKFVERMNKQPLLQAGTKIYNTQTGEYMVLGQSQAAP